MGRPQPAADHRPGHGAHRGIQEGRFFQAAGSRLTRAIRGPARRSEPTRSGGRSSSARFTILPRPGGGRRHRPRSVSRATSFPQSRWDPVAKNIIQKVGIQDPTLPTLLRNIPTINGQPVFHLQTWGVKGRPPAQLEESAIGLLQPQLSQPLQQWRGALPAVSRSRLQFVAAADHSRAPGAAVAHLHDLAALINRAAAGFNRFLNQEWSLSDHHQCGPCLGHRTAKPARARCSR